MTVTLTIHRSAHEIGGNCIEVAFGAHRLLLDAGMPLSAADREVHTSLLPTSLDRGRPVDGVVISHPHRDHWGLLDALPSTWPVFTGRASEKLIRLTTQISGSTLQRPLSNYTAGETFAVGPSRVTPYLTDHSAFDAHMLLVEVGGKRIFYTGDFRTNGRKSALAEQLMRLPPKNIDVLLMEGTTLGRSESFPTEAELEDKFVDLCRATTGQVYVTWSAQNLDRSVSLYRAAKRSGRTLVLDIYSAHVWEIVREFARLPPLEDSGLRVVITRSLADLYQGKLQLPQHVSRCIQHGMGARNLLEQEGRFLVMLRSSLWRAYKNKGVRARSQDAWSFSMWRGYLEQPGYAELESEFRDAGAVVNHIHTSGHASKSELLRFANAIAPAHLVPIHSLAWDEYRADFPNIVRLADGELFAIP